VLNGIGPSKGAIETYVVYNRRDIWWCPMMEFKVKIGVITLVKKRAEIKAVIVKGDLASIDRRVVAIR
jgi:hypothetical protein